MDNFRRAVIYARYSSHSQRDASIEQQVAACRRFAERQDIEIVDVYEDRATTGTNDRRPGFQKLVKDAERRSWEYVIVYTLDRFARDRYASAVYKRRLKDCGVKVLSAMEQISDDPTGILMESLLEGLAEYYSSELSRKIRRGMDDNAAKCLCNGQIPFGYRRGEDGRFAIDEQEAPIVQEIYRRIRDGAKMSELIHDINARGILNKRGKKWTHSTFNTLLQNERYTGIYIYKDVRIPGGMPRIIDTELFDAVQMIMHTKKNPRKNTALSDDTRAALPQRRRQENGIYYLTGKLFCGHCHEPMIGISGRSKSGPLYYYYTCKGKRTAHKCQKKNVNRDYIEKFIATALKETMLNDRAIRILADTAVEYQKKKAVNAELDALVQRAAEVKKSIGNIVAAIETGIFSAATQSRLAELEAEQRTLLMQISYLQEETEEQLTREEIIATLELFKDGDICDESFREALIDTFLVAAYVYDDEVKIVFNLGGKSEYTSLPFDIDSLTLDETCIDDIKLHQILLYKPFPRPVAVFGDLFVFTQKMQGP
jgi:DNA invertase Pin-like site-specific DNA recombinase